MLKKLWNAASFLAVVNLLAMFLLSAWLYRSDRLNIDRVREIRQMLSVTVAEEAVSAAAAEEQALKDAHAELQRKKDESPLPPAVRQVHFLERMDQSEHDRQRRMTSELADLRSTLALREQTLANARAEFAEERAGWDAERERVASEAADAQFQQVVKLLESVPPKQAKGHLRDLIDAGDTDQAVAYLRSMKSYNASLVLKEFKTDEDRRVATELLARMESYGTQSGVAEASRDADATDPTG